MNAMTVCKPNDPLSTTQPHTAETPASPTPHNLPGSQLSRHGRSVRSSRRSFSARSRRGSWVHAKKAHGRPRPLIALPGGEPSLLSPNITAEMSLPEPEGGQPHGKGERSEAG